jgi:Mg-chelatase subunit ChlD
VTPDSPKTPREELEARLTALLLGELSADEAVALRHTIEQDPELARLENQLKETIGLVRQAAASKDEKTIEPAAALQLSAERREKLLASFKTERLETPWKPRRTLRLNRELLKLAAMVVALLLVSGVLISYLTKSMKSMTTFVAVDPGELAPGSVIAGVPARDAEQGRPVVVTVNADSDPARGRFKPADSPAPAINKPAPASGTRAGNSSDALITEYSADAGLEKAKAQILAHMSSRSAQTTPPPAGSPTPAKALPELAQNSERFRTAIALPTPLEPQANDSTFDASGEMLARSGAAPVGRASSRADAFGSSTIAGSDKVQVEALGEETKLRTGSGLAGGQGGGGLGGLGGNRGSGGLGGIASGGGGLGGGRGPIAAAEGKDSGRLPDAGIPTANVLAFVNQIPGKSQQFGDIADGIALPNVGNVPVTPAQPGALADGKASGLAAPNAYWGTGSNGIQVAAGNRELWEGESFGLANKELPAMKPSQVANSDWFEAKDVNGPVPVRTQSPAGPASPPALIAGRPAPVISPSPVPAAAPTTAMTGLPVDADLPTAAAGARPQIETVRDLSREGAVLAGDNNRNLDGTVDGEDAVFRKGREAPRTIPNRPVRLAGIPVETPAPAPKVQTKAVAGRTVSVSDDLAETIELHNAITNSFFAFVNGSTAAEPGKQAAGSSLSDLSATLIPDPTHGIGDSREWGLGQKPDADGDRAARLSQLADLTQSQSKKQELDGVRNQLGKVDRGDAVAVHSINAVGFVTNAVILPTATPKAPPAADEERKKQAANSEKVGMSRVDGYTIYGQSIVTEGAAKTSGQLVVPGTFTTSEDSKRASEEAVFRKSRVDIALPPGGENAQGVEREPRVQAGPVAVNEIQVESVIRESQPRTGLSTGRGFGGAGRSAEAAQARSSFAQRLNQTVNRAASGAGNNIQLNGKAEVADLSANGFSEQLGKKQAELDRLNSLQRSLETASFDDLKKMASSANPDPTLASLLQDVDVMTARQSLDLQKQDSKPKPASQPMNKEIDEALMGGIRANVKAKLERLQTEVAKEKSLNLSDLKGASLSQVLDEYGRLSGRKVLQAGALPATGGITVDSPTPLSREEALGALDAVLAMNQLATTVQGTDFVKVVPVPQAAQEAEKLSDVPSELLPDSSNIVTRVVQLKNALPNDVQQVIQPFAKLPQSIITVPNSSMIVLRDKPENVNRMVEMIQKVDVVPVQEFVDVVIPIQTAPAADVVRMLQSSTATGDLFVLAQTKIIVDERNNSLLVFASRQDLDSISNAIRRLDAPIPQGEVEAAENFFSTFSLNVSDVSFKLAAASLEKGQMPDPATVRSEEFINAFDYRDPEPKGSAPIAFAWERTRYPFAHNRDLLRFSVKTAASGRQPGRPLNLVLLLDNSGSMERADRVRVRMECLRVLGRQLRPEDRVSVVAFARTARLVLDGISGKDGANLPEWAGQLAPDGGTNLEDAMNLAYQTALRHFLPNGVNRVVLLTDGAANLGDVEPESLKKKVEAHRKQGVALDCFGIGWDGYNDDLLEVLSRNGDGRYGFVNTPEAASSEFAGQLAGALRVAASDVKVQVQFNPRRVTAWRQIGYARHQLKKEQFRDNTVDAAEIGAAEQGNALYTVQVNPNGEGPLGVVRVRFKVPGTSDYREHEWAVPYSGAATPLEQSSPALRLAATASAFSEWLVSSPFAAEVTPDRLLGYLSGVPETCAADPRPKKLEWMIRQAKSLAGK